MATTIHAALARLLFRPETCGPMEQCVKGDPKHTVPVPYHEPLENTTHTTLRVHKAIPTPTPTRFSLSVLNGSNGKKIDVKVNSSDTIGKLQEEVLRLSPDLGASLNLVFNGKPLHPCQTLSELQVKPGATFITYQKCIGG